MKIKLLNPLVHPFNTQHTLPCLRNNLTFVNDSDDNFDIGLVLDPAANITTFRQCLQKAYDCKQKNRPVVYIVYDPFGFAGPDIFIKNNLLDKIVLFDKQFKDRFPTVETIISEYVMNEALFPDKVPVKTGNLCYYGHLGLNRKLPPNTVQLKNEHTDIPITFDSLIAEDFKKLFRTVSTYHGSVIVPSGRDEAGNGILYHNKGKIVEALMSGTTPYVTNKIESITYQNYINFDINISPKVINISEIRKINQKNIAKLCKVITNK